MVVVPEAPSPEELEQSESFLSAFTSDMAQGKGMPTLSARRSRARVALGMVAHASVRPFPFRRD